MRIGMIGTGAVANKHAEAYARLGFEIVACTSQEFDIGRDFAKKYGGVFLESAEAVCRHPDVQIVDVCTLPNFRIEAVALCAENHKHVQVEKPIALSTDVARRMIDLANKSGILLGVVSQHRFDDSSLFLQKALADERLGRLIECDAYVKWHRAAEYYARPGKGTWKTEGGGALINQAIHQVDLLRFFAGPVHEVYANWQLGALHAIESEDVINALIRYKSGATGVIQASTAFWPGYPERVELHGTKGTAIVTGDKLTTWDVQGDSGPQAPVVKESSSGASDPMAISVESFERQFLDFADAIKTGRKPRVDAEEGYAALEFVDSIYRSCRERRCVNVGD